MASAIPASHSPPAEPVPILTATRAGIALLALLAAANGAFLYLLPSQAATDYAWPIAPPINAAVLGAGYVGGLAGTGLALLARRWRSVRALQPGFVLLGATLFAATIIHEDRFRWDYPPTIAWTVVYAGLPTAIALLWWLQERRGPRAPPRDPRVRAPAGASALPGAVMVVLAMLLFLAPAEAVERWPWEITPLLARVFAGWYALAGLTLLFAGVSARQVEDLAIPYLTVGTWSAFLLPLPALYPDGVDGGAPELWAWLALHALTLAVCAWSVIRAAGVARTRICPASRES